MRNSVTARMRTEKKEWEQKKLNNAEHNSSTLWRNVKSWLNWGNSGPPTKLFQDGVMITSPARLAGAMNSFFVTKVNLLQEQIPQAVTDPLAKLREVMQHRRCTFSLRSVSPDDVSKTIAGLKNSKSTGIDFIDTWVIKLVASSYCQP